MTDLHTPHPLALSTFTIIIRPSAQCSPSQLSVMPETRPHYKHKPKVRVHAALVSKMVGCAKKFVAAFLGMHCQIVIAADITASSSAAPHHDN
eukprot:scaffold23974_cov88-Skeletonema_dohrnii-CCMP3373.AAC.3